MAKKIINDDKMSKFLNQNWEKQQKAQKSAGKKTAKKTTKKSAKKK